MRHLVDRFSTPAVVPSLDAAFRPASLFNRKFREWVRRSHGVLLRLALERADGSVSTYATDVLPDTSPDFPANLWYVERLVKFLLWQRGGWKLYVGGPAEIGRHIQESYAPNGIRQFDAEFMGAGSMSIRLPW